MYIHSLTPWSRVLEKLLVTQLVKKFATFMDPRGSLSCSQETTTCPYSEPMNPVHIFPPFFPKIHSNIILPPMPGSTKWSLPIRLSISVTFNHIFKNTNMVIIWTWHHSIYSLEIFYGVRSMKNKEISLR